MNINEVHWNFSDNGTKEPAKSRFWNFYNFWTAWNFLMRFSLLYSGEWALSFYICVCIYIGVSLSKFCDVHIEIKYISSNWMLFEKQLWRHSLWLVTSRDIPQGVIVVNRFSRVASAKFEIFARSKKHSIPLRNAHLKLLATIPNTI